MAAGFEEYADPRLVAVYDSWEPERADIPFFVDLAAQLPATSVVDIGCGTGRLAVELARRGHQVTGLDPSPAMLEVARGRPGGELVRWVEGDASCLGHAEYDLALLTGHVVQVINDDRALLDTFAAVRRALRPGGRLSFDSRNPAARCWTSWTPDASRRTLAGGVQAWFQETLAQGDRVRYETHYLFPTGEELVSRNELRFRSYVWLRHALTDAGFEVAPMDFDDPHLVFLATAAGPRRVVAMRISGAPPNDWQANLLYDSGEALTVSLAGLNSLDLLATLHRLRVPEELVYQEMRELGVDWNPAAEVRLRSEADMAAWRRRDREQREQRKRDFLRRQSGG